MLPNEGFQKLLYDLFCLWHRVQRHYDPPITDSDEVTFTKVKSLICKLLGEIDGRVSRIRQDPNTPKGQDFYEEWTMLTWNVLCITSRLQEQLSKSFMSQEDRMIYSRLNQALVDLVNFSRDHLPFPGGTDDAEYATLRQRMSHTMLDLHTLYRAMNTMVFNSNEEVEMFRVQLLQFGEQTLVPCIDLFKTYCNKAIGPLWFAVRASQINRMRDLNPLPDTPVTSLVSFYSQMMYVLAVLGARLQGFRYDLTMNKKVFGQFDPVQPLSEAVFSALELLMSDCVLSTEPSTNAILVTNNLFSIFGDNISCGLAICGARNLGHHGTSCIGNGARFPGNIIPHCPPSIQVSKSGVGEILSIFSMNCGALARGVVFKDFEIQVVSEETAEHIQSDMSRQRLLNQPSPIGTFSSAALLAMKQTSGTKRANAASNQSSSGHSSKENLFSESTSSNTNTTHKKSDVNSKESVTIYPIYNAKNRYWAANYPHLLCTTRQKGRHSTHNSFQDLSPSSQKEDKSNGKRPIFYFHIKASMFSPSGRFATAHTLSLPFTIATRRNQDCQVQRMMSSYTATIFWIYGCNQQENLLLLWHDIGMGWDHFKHLYKQHFKVNASVERGLIDEDLNLLKYKLQCPDCITSDQHKVNGVQQIVTFKNVLCPHLRYECGSTNVRFSVWRGMLELLQIFHDTRNNVRKLWEMGLLLGFLEFTDVDNLLSPHKSALVMRLSFVTGVKSLAHTLDPSATKPIHLEPLDLKKLQQKGLKDYLRDISDAEKVKYIINAKHEVVKISEVLAELGETLKINGETESRDISSNVTHSGDIDSMQHIKFTAMRIAVVTCKVKPPSADDIEEVDRGMNRLSALVSPQDDFMREIVQLANFHGKSKQDVLEALDSVSDNWFSKPSYGPPPLAPAAAISPVGRESSRDSREVPADQLPSPVFAHHNGYQH